MWFRRPRVEDMQTPEGGECLTKEEIEMLAEDSLGPFDAPYPIRSKEEMEEDDLDHPLSTEALLAWHSQITASGRAQAEFGLSLLEDVPPPEPGTRAYEKEFGPEPLAEAAPPPTIQDTWRTTQEVWVSWLRGKKKR